MFVRDIRRYDELERKLSKITHFYYINVIVVYICNH